MNAQRYAEALQIFRQLHEQEPSVGALFNIAAIEERTAHPVAAWATYQDAAALAQAKRDEREVEARTRAAALEALLPRLVVREPAPSLEIVIGAPVAASAWNRPLLRRIGAYTLVARAPCRKPLALPITIVDEARPPDIVVPPLDLDPACRASAASDTAKTWRFAGYGVGAAGLVALGVGAVLGLEAYATKADLDVACGGSYAACQPVDRAAVEEQNSVGRSQAAWSTIGFVAGGGLLVAAVTMLLLAPRPR